jgi:hypothetical protein
MLCGHSALFSGTFPTSGTWDGTGLYPLPTPAHRTAGSGSSSSRGLMPTPAANDSGNSPEDHLRKKPGRSQVTSLKVIAEHGLIPSGGLLMTPTANLGANGGAQHPDKRKAGGHGPTLADQVEHLLPTPTARDGKGPNQRGDSSCLHGAILGDDTQELSPDGRPCSDGLPLGQLSLGDLENG